MVRYVFLNALPLNALNISKPTKLIITPVKPEVLKQLAPEMQPKASYIRHPATVQLLNKLFNLNLSVSSELYKYQQGDVIYVITLKKPVRGAEIENITENDIEIYHVETTPEI